MRAHFVPLKRVALAVVNDEALAGLTWKQTWKAEADACCSTWTAAQRGHVIAEYRGSVAKLLGFLIKYEPGSLVKQVLCPSP